MDHFILSDIETPKNWIEENIPLLKQVKIRRWRFKDTTLSVQLNCLSLESVQVELLTCSRGEEHLKESDIWFVIKDFLGTVEEGKYYINYGENRIDHKCVTQIIKYKSGNIDAFNDLIRIMQGT